MDVSNSENFTLIDRIIAGDHQAFMIFVERYQRLVSHIVYRMIENPAAREDLCQEIFIKAYKNLNSFKKRSQVSTWIGKIAYNTCVNHLRKIKAPLIDDLSEANKHITRSSSDYPSPVQFAEQEDTAGLLKEAVDLLPPNYRTALTLYHVDEMSYSQIGEIMSLPDGTVKSHIFRARQLLKKILLNKYQPEDIIV